MVSTKSLIFVDTSMFKALVDDRDDFYPEAIKIWKNLKPKKPQLITSNYILDETFTLLRQRRGRDVVDKFRKKLVNFYEIKVIRVTLKDEANAWKWFFNDWSDLSYTDCTSFAIMERLKIQIAASFDRDFKRAGFKVVT